MGTVLRIPAVNKPARSEIILSPEEDIGQLIAEYMGVEIADVYHAILEELNDVIKQIDDVPSDTDMRGENE